MVGTQAGGYVVKKYNAAFQSVTLDPDPHSDCGTEKTFKILVTDFNKKLIGSYRYIKENGKKKLITPLNIDQYVGRTIDLYDPIYCKGDKLCNKCAGDLYYKLDLLNAGTTVQKIGSTILNKCLKKKHDNTLKLYHITSIDDLVL